MLNFSPRLGNLCLEISHQNHNSYIILFLLHVHIVRRTNRPFHDPPSLPGASPLLSFSDGCFSSPPTLRLITRSWKKKRIFFFIFGFPIFGRWRSYRFAFTHSPLTLSNLSPPIFFTLFRYPLPPLHLPRCVKIQISLECVGDKGYHQAFLGVLIDLNIQLLVLIIKPFDNQTEIFRELVLIIKFFDNQAFWDIWLMIKSFDYFVYKTFTHESHKTD